MAKIAGLRSKDAGQDAEMQQNQGQLVSLLCTQQKLNLSL